MSVQPRIILTVPHGTCSPILIGEHYCDFIAEQMGTLLHDALSKKLNNVSAQTISYDISLIVEKDIPRSHIDENRDIARQQHTPFRTKISDSISQSPSGSILIDIHSFPNNPEHLESYNTPFYIIDPSIDIFYPANNLSMALSHTTIPSAAIFRSGSDEFGQNVNDIIRQASESGINSTLIEFNEQLTSDGKTRLIERIANVIVSIIRK